MDSVSTESVASTASVRADIRVISAKPKSTNVRPIRALMTGCVITNWGTTGVSALKALQVSCYFWLEKHFAVHKMRFIYRYIEQIYSTEKSVLVNMSRKMSCLTYDSCMDISHTNPQW